MKYLWVQIRFSKSRKKMCDKICGDESDRSLGAISGSQEPMQQSFVTRIDYTLDFFNLTDFEWIKWKLPRERIPNLADFTKVGYGCENWNYLRNALLWSYGGAKWRQSSTDKVVLKYLSNVSNRPARDVIVVSRWRFFFFAFTRHLIIIARLKCWSR